MHIQNKSPELAGRGSGPDMTLFYVCGSQERSADWNVIAVALHCCKPSRIGHSIWWHTIAASFFPGIHTFPTLESQKDHFNTTTVFVALLVTLFS